MCKLNMLKNGNLKENNDLDDESLSLMLVFYCCQLFMFFTRKAVICVYLNQELSK